jgi:hypothetical protein
VGGVGGERVCWGRPFRRGKFCKWIFPRRHSIKGSSRLTGDGSWTAALKEVTADGSFLRSRKLTWTCVLWSGYIATWHVVTGSGLAIVAVWWLVGMVVFGQLWLAPDRKPFRHAR